VHYESYAKSRHTEIFEIVITHNPGKTVFEKITPLTVGSINSLEMKDFLQALIAWCSIFDVLPLQLRLLFVVFWMKFCPKEDQVGLNDRQNAAIFPRSRGAKISIVQRKRGVSIINPYGGTRITKGNSPIPSEWSIAYV